MKVKFILFVCLVFLISGCSEKTKRNNENSSQNEIKESTVIGVENIANCPWAEENMKKINFGCDVTREGELTYLYGYRESGKQKYIIADYQGDNSWEMRREQWEKNLWKETSDAFTDLAVCSDGSYIGVIQPEDNLPIFYYLKNSGEVEKWVLSSGVLEWKKDRHEKVQWITMDDKDRIVLSTYISNPENEGSEEISTSIVEYGRMIVYDKHTSQIITERAYVGEKNNTCVVGEYAYTARATGETAMRAYRLDGGEAQLIMTNQDISKDISEQSFVCYRGGNYGYWYTDKGIYRFPVKNINTKEKLKLIVSADAYVKNSQYNVTNMTCSEGNDKMSFYVRIITHVINEAGEISAGTPILTCYSE